MARFSIREVRFPSGEHLPILVEGNSLGMPDNVAMRYVLTKCRVSGKKANTIRQKLRSLALAFQFFDARRIDLIERAAKQQFLTLEELVALSERCRLKSDSSSVVVPSYAASQYSTCIDFIEWTSEPVLSRIHNDRHRYAAAEALKRFLKRAKSTAPASKSHNSNIPGERLGFTPEQRALFLKYIKPGAIGNPFGEKLQHRNYALLLLSFSLAPRPGEVLGLKVRDIDFQTSPASLTIHRRHDDTEEPRSDPPNSKTLGRLLLLGDELRDVLDEWICKHRSNKKGFPAARKHPYLFTNYRGEALSSRGYRKVIETLRRHHPEFEDVCLYILRHDFNDRWVENTKNNQHESSVLEQKYHNGWSPNSSMPFLYGKRAIRNAANRKSLELQKKAFVK